jgi:hypothetical protein
MVKHKIHNILWNFVLGMATVLVFVKSSHALILDDFNYDKKSVPTVWQSVNDNGWQPPKATVAKGKPFGALVAVFYCPFSQLKEGDNCKWQRNFKKVDVSGFDQVELDVYVVNAALIKDVEITLLSPQGQLSQKVTIEKNGWQTIKFPLKDFRGSGISSAGKSSAEKSSAGKIDYRNPIEAIRFSIGQAKGRNQDSYVAIGQFRSVKIGSVKSSATKIDSSNSYMGEDISVESY